MASLKGTKTEANLWTAFAGESQTRNKYTYFSEMAKTEGYENIATVFETIANQEREHAKHVLNYLNGIRDTETNLKVASQSENYEGDTMYAEFSKVARSEGLDEIADFFEKVAAVELEHEKVFQSLLKRLQENNRL
ncbi:MAG: rubrerythrin family protein [Clostridiaceae bacterium]|nr:rubrerythrin family protein [Clostridiaceae bacterium]